MGSEPKFTEPSARPPGAVLRTAAKLVSDPNNSAAFEDVNKVRTCDFLFHQIITCLLGKSLKVAG